MFELHGAYWRGEFEKRGQGCLEYQLGRTGPPHKATRELISRLVGWGSEWIPTEVYEARSGPPQWRAIARVDEEEFWEFPRWYRRMFGDFTIPKSDLDRWMKKRTATGEDDRVRRKIQTVLREAARLERAEHGLSKRDIAKRLTSEGRSGGYGSENVRKILSGTLREQVRRGIPNLRRWMEKRR